MARAIDGWWVELGRPDPFVVVEAGAGRGVLARDVLASSPDCAPALRYLLVERSPLLRERQGALLALEPSSMVFGPAAAGQDDDADARPEPGVGPLVAASAHLPAERFTGLVLANELLDNLPFGLLEKTDRGWAEVRVAASGDALVEVLVPCDEGPQVDVPPGARVPLQRVARQWVESALSRLHRGRVVAVDYADTTEAFGHRPWTEWVRTYRDHAPGAGALAHPGEQDITCEVAIDQLPPPTHASTQAAFLRANGLEELVAEARLAAADRAGGVTIASLAAASRVSEAAALSDPAGLGGFTVLEWVARAGSPR